MKTQNATLRKYLFRSLAIISGIILSIILLELTIPLFGIKYLGANTNKFYSNYRGYFKKTALDQHNQIYYTVDYNIDVDGYRIAPNTKKLQTSPTKKQSILMLGDSFVFGQGVKYADIYSTRLQKMLDANNYSIFVKNCGLSGRDLPAIAQIYDREEKRGDYSVIVYGFVLNDFVLPNFQDIQGDDLIDQDNNIPREYDFVRAHSNIYNLIIYSLRKINLHKITIKAYLDIFRGEYAQMRFKELRELNQEITSHNQKLVIMLFPLFYNLNHYPFSEIHQKMEDFCKEEKIAFLDLLPHYTQFKTKDLWVHPVDHHPNDIAHKIAAEQLYTFLTNKKLID